MRTYLLIYLESFISTANTTTEYPRRWKIIFDMVCATFCTKTHKIFSDSHLYLFRCANICFFTSTTFTCLFAGAKNFACLFEIWDIIFKWVDKKIDILQIWRFIKNSHPKQLLIPESSTGCLQDKGSTTYYPIGSNLSYLLSE